jgi:hypothetical protein
LIEGRQTRITISVGLLAKLEKLVQDAEGRFGANVSAAITQLLPDAVDAAYARLRTSMENEQKVDELRATVSRSKPR